MERKFATTLMICTALIVGNISTAFASGEPAEGIQTDTPTEKTESDRIDNTTPQTYDNISIKNKAVPNNNGGGFKNTAVGETTITNSEIDGNTAEGGHGGGIYNDLGATMVIDNTIISGNEAEHGGGVYNDSSTITIKNSTIEGNIGSGPSNLVAGGGVEQINGGTTELINTKVINNNGGQTGGIAIYHDNSKVIIKGGEISGNTGGQTGAIDASSNTMLDISGGTVIKGNKGYTGGIKAFGATVNLDDVTFSENTKTFDYYCGGALTNNSSTINMSNVTFEKGTDTAKNDILNEGGTINVNSGQNNFSSDIKNISDGTLSFIGGTSEINGTLTNEGTLDLQSGSIITGTGSIVNSSDMTLASDVSGFNGTYSQTSNATTTVLNKFFKGSQKIDNGSTVNWQTTQDQGTGNSLTVTKGTLNIGSAAATSALDSPIAPLADTPIDGSFNVTTQDQITKEAEVNITSTGELNVKTGGSATLNQGPTGTVGNDTIEGKMNVEGGKLTLDKVTNRSGALNATAGEVEFKQGSVIQANDLISSGVKIDIETGTTTPMSGGSVTASGDQSGWQGTLSQTGGDLTLDSVTNRTGALVSDGGSLVLEGTNVIKANDSVSGKTALTLGADDILNLTGGSLNLDGANGTDILKDTWEGKVNQTGGVLVVDNFGATHGNLVSNGGELTFKGNNTLADNDEIGKTANTKLAFDDGSNTTIQGTADVTVNSDDAINGSITQNGAKLTIDGAARGENSVLTSTNGELNLKNTSIQGTDNVAEATKVDLQGAIDIKGGSLALNQNAADSSSNDTISGNINLENGTLSLDNVDNRSGKLNLTGGILKAIGTLTKIKDGDSIKNTQITTDTTDVLNIEGGTVEIKGDNTANWKGTLNQTAGNITLEGVKKTGNLLSDGGTLNLNASGDGTKNSLTSGDSVKKATTVNVNGGLDLQGGELTLDSGDSINADVTQTTGTLNLSNLGTDRNGSKDGTGGSIISTGGTINTDGTTHILGSADGTTGDNISKNTQVNITSGTLEIDGGSVTLDGSDDLSGNVKLDNGKLTLDTISADRNGAKDGNGGAIIVTGGNLDIKGDFNINNTSDDIQKNAKVNIASGKTTVSAGKVTLDTFDTITGNVEQTGGSLTLDTLNQTRTGSIKSTGGSLTLEGENVLNNSADSIDSNTSLNIKNGATLDIQKGTVAIDGADGTNISKDTWTGTIKTGENGTLNINNLASNSNGALIAQDGTINVSNSSLTLNSDSSIDNAADLTFTNSNLTINGADVEFNSGDTLGANISMSAGSLTLNSISKTDDKTLKTTGGTLNIIGEVELNNVNDYLNDATILNIGVKNPDDSITDGKLAINNGKVEIGSNDNWLGTLEVHNNGSLKVANGNNGNGKIIADNGSVEVDNGTTLEVASGSSITDEVKTTVAGNLNITGGSVELNQNSTNSAIQNDVVSGDVSMSNGTLSLDNVDNRSGKLNLTGGILKAIGTLTKIKDGDSITGTQIITDTDDVLNIESGSVEVKNDNTSNWNGKLAQTGGTLTLDNVVKTGALTSDGGALNIKGTTELSNAQDNISANTAVSIAQSDILNVKNGSVTINKGTGSDDWKGTINVSDSGRVTIKDFKTEDTHGTLNAQSGSLNFENSKFQIDSNTVVAENAVVSIDDKSTLTVISGGDLTLNNLADGTVQDDWQGAVILDGGHVTVKNMDSIGSLSGDKGDLDIINSKLTFDSDSKIADEVNIDFDSNSTITVDGAQLTLDKTGDNWQGEVNLKSGKLTVSGFNNDTGSLKSEAGELYLKKSNLEITGDSSIGDKTTLSVDSDSTLTVKDSSNASLADKGGKVTLNQDSTWEGKVSLNGVDSKLTLDNVNAKKERTGILEALKGALDIKGMFITKANDTIDKAAVLEVQDGATLDIKGGNVTIDNDDTIKGTLLTSAYEENSKLTLDSVNDNNKERGNIQIKLGKVDIKNSVINLITRNSKADTIEKDANVNIMDGSKVSAGAGGSLTLNKAADETNDTWAGDIELDGGTITLDNMSDHTGSITTTTNGGTLNIQGSETKLIAGDEINKQTVVNIEKNGVLNIDGAKMVLSDNDNWNEAKVVATSGTLDLDNVNKNGALDVQGADLNIINSSITIKDNDIIDGTKSIVNFDAASKIDITGGSVKLDNDDIRNGTLVLDGENAELTFVNVKPIKVPGGGPDKPIGSLVANSGKLTFDNCDVLVDGDIQIGLGTGLTATGSSLTVTDKGVLSLANNSEIDENSKIYLISDTPDGEGGTLNYGGEGATLKLDATKGNLNLLKGAKLALSGTGGSARVENQVVVDIQKDAELKIQDGFELKLDGVTDNPNKSDKWSGKLINENSVAIISNIENSPTASLVQKKIGDDPATAAPNTAQTNITANSDIKLGIDSSIDSGEINITDNSKLTVVDGSIVKGGDFNIDSTSEFSSLSNDLKIDNMKLSGTVSAMNDSIETYKIDNMMIGTPATADTPSDNIADLTIDLFARADNYKNSDKFVVGNVQNVSGEESAILNLKDWNLTGDVYGYGAPIDRHISFGNILQYEAGDDVELQVTQKEAFTPIGYYKLNRASTGGYSLDLTSYNKQVFRGAITTLAQWENQLAINDILFNHSMLMPNYESDYRHSSMVNKISAISPQFAPYQYSKKDGAVWYRAYGNFENLQMANHVKVGNNSWGVLVGTDFGLKDLKKGWKYMPTVYLGYNAAHQSFHGAGATQQGGQLGYLGTFYRNNTILGTLIYGGIYGNYMDVYNTTDDTFNYFGGVAFKAAQNFRLGKSKSWILQPNLLAAYNYFGEQSWHSDFGQMNMTTGMLNGVNVAPGINLIWQKEAFSAYLTLQYMFNVNGAVSSTAGNVDLPSMSMQRGYIQYGIGFTRTFTDRVSGFFQSVLRNAGRTGVGFMAGVDIVLGKEGKKIKK